MLRLGKRAVFQRIALPGVQARSWWTLHLKWALTMIGQPFNFRPSTIERIGSSKISQSEVDWVISSAGQPAGQPDPKKPTALRGEVGVWDCESSNRIKGL